MEKFTQLTGVAAPLPIINLDTDKIFPAIYLKTIKRTGLSKWLFEEIRFRPDGSENPDFVLNQAPYRNAKILIGADNFGCGSSREHAPWALLDFGIRCVIAPSFADIFYNNCFKNGILPIALAEGDRRRADGRRQERRQRGDDDRSGRRRRSRARTARRCISRSTRSASIAC